MMRSNKYECTNVMIIFFIQRMMLPINYEKQTEHFPPEQTSGALQGDSAPHKRKVVRG
jgi:hypothetical protein